MGITSRLLRRGGGTALPGLVAERVYPHLVRDLAAQLHGGSVIVAGTNGKTTTTRMLSGILRDAGLHPVQNDSGSNLMRGLASALLKYANVWGNISAANERLGLFEVDEAALPAAMHAIRPHSVLLLDLFRDQLDRYGEVASISRLWSSALAANPHTTEVVANADDPLIVDAVRAANGPLLYFGIESAESTIQRAHASDVKACPQCGGEIVYSVIFLGHLGHYACGNCHFARPSPTVFATQVHLNGVTGSTFTLKTPEGMFAVTLPIPGMYNVYNALAAAALATARGIAGSEVAASLGRATAAFGRMERLAVDGRTVYLALAKNPTGLNEVIRTLTQSASGLNLLVLLNDNAADGHDVSWIWDADVEQLLEKVASVTFSGLRAEDMAVRFKYAGIVETRDGPPWKLIHDTATALAEALQSTPVGDVLFIVPTYTAMLDIRDVLVRQGHITQYWEV